MKTLIKTKVCNKCNQRKPITEFHKHERGKFGVKAVCKECFNKQQKERYIPVQKNLTPEWSISAIACMLRHCVCSGCLMSDLESKCRMKKTVIELVKQYGRPIQYKEPTIRED